MDKITKGLGAERHWVVVSSGGYFGAMQLLADIDARFKRTRIDDLTVEIHVVQEPLTGQKAADLFGEIGPRGGESTEEIMGLLSEARRRGGRREVRDL